MRSPTRATRLFLLTALLALALIAAGCGSDDGDDSGGTTAAAPAEPAETTTDAAAEDEAADAGSSEKQKPKPEKKGTTIKLAGSPVGDALFDADDQAIYLFDIETSGKSECYDACAEAWPPVLTKGEPQAKGEISQKKLGTTKRDDGTVQVTYNGHPLYYYFDEGPGELRCHNVPGFGGLWLALGADGNPL